MRRCSPGTAVGDCLTDFGFVSFKANVDTTVISAIAHTNSVIPSVDPSIFAISHVMTMGVEPDTTIALS